LLESAQGEAPVTLYVTPQILCEFYAIVTNGRRVLKPRSSADALAAISDMLGFLRVLPVPVTAIDEVMALLRRHPVTGGEIFDLQIIATMKLNGIFANLHFQRRRLYALLRSRASNALTHSYTTDQNDNPSSEPSPRSSLGGYEARWPVEYNRGRIA
jgi:hypothetical protein